MDISLVMPQVVAFLLVMIRISAWLMVSPPFNTRAIPGRVKVLVAAGLSLPLAVPLADQTRGMSTGEVVGSVITQVLAGLAMGFVTYLLFAAFETAGNIMDVSTGFSVAQQFDPMTQSTSSVFGRFHNMLAVVLMLATGAHLVIFGGLFKSFTLLRLDGELSPSVTTAGIASTMTTFFVTAIQIAAPMVGIMFLVDLGMSLLNRVAPAMNVFTLGFSIKILLSLLVVAFTFPLLPGIVNGVSQKAAEAVISIAGGGGGG
jgi:flagellar biosynthesis protein FliR